MKSIVCAAKHRLELTEGARPLLDNRADEVLLKVRAVGICGSDIHAYGGANPLFEYPKTIGHELCAVVEEISAAAQTDLQVGDQVTVVPYLSCGQCQACEMGRQNCCEQLSVMGVHIDGGLSEFIKVPSQYLIKVPDSFSAELTAMIEPLAISEHAVARGAISERDILLVVGAGPIGLGVVMMGLTRTRQVIVADVDPNRLDFCERNYAVKTINVAAGAIKDRLLELTGGKFATAIIDATGSEQAMNADIHLLCNGGRIVFVGIHKGDICLNDMDFHKRETTLVASRAADKCDFENVIKQIDSGRIDPLLMRTHTTDIEHFIPEFEQQWLQQGSGLIKGIVTL